jgi:hypothetical protein
MECSELARTGVKGLDRPVLNIDHHPGNTGYGALNWVDESAAACGEMVCTLVDALGVPLSADIATHLQSLAVLTDTGSFHFPTCRRARSRWRGGAWRRGQPQWTARTHYDATAWPVSAFRRGAQRHGHPRRRVRCSITRRSWPTRGTNDDPGGPDQLPAHGEGDRGRASSLSGDGDWRSACGRRAPWTSYAASSRGGHTNAAGCSARASCRRASALPPCWRWTPSEKLSLFFRRCPVIDCRKAPRRTTAVARRALGESRIGHTGTLDPMATGVLPSWDARRAWRSSSPPASGLRRHCAVRPHERHLRRHRHAGQSPRPTRDALHAAFALPRHRPDPPASAKSIDGERAHALAARRRSARPAAAAATVTVERPMTASTYRRALGGLRRGRWPTTWARRWGWPLAALRRTRRANSTFAGGAPDELVGGREAADRLVPIDSPAPCCRPSMEFVKTAGRARDLPARFYSPWPGLLARTAAWWPLARQDPDCTHPCATAFGLTYTGYRRC